MYKNLNLRYAIVETLGLAHDNVINLCVMSAALLDRVATWWRQSGECMLHLLDLVLRIAFEDLGRLVLKFSTRSSIDWLVISWFRVRIRLLFELTG
jgi:hypothetical protein